MITHDAFTFLRHTTKKTIGIFYGTIDDFEPEDLKDYNLTPVPFEKLDCNTLQELLSNILEDYNLHFRSQYEPKLLVDCIKKTGGNDTFCANFLRNYIIGLEKQYNR